MKVMRRIRHYLARMFLWCTKIMLGREFPGHRSGITDALELELEEEMQESEIPPAKRREMVRSIYKMGSTIVREVMVPRTNMSTVKTSDSLDQAVNVIREKGRSRIPVYEEKIDNIVGVLYAKDVLRCIAEEKASSVNIEQLMRPALFVPETKNVYALLQELQNKRTHIAIVIDEYGGTSGLVTFEDLIEEIVGEFQDEYEKGEAPIRQLDAQTFEVDAKMALPEVNEELGLDLPVGEDYDTLGGMIIAHLGRIPKAKERLHLAGVKLVIAEADERSIGRVRIVKKAQPSLEREEPSGEEEGST